MAFLKNTIKKLPKIFVNQRFSTTHMDYDNYWENKGSDNISKLNPYQEYRANFIARNIEENSSLLDIGTGEANILKKLIEEKNINAHGSDISELSKERLNTLGINHLIIDLANVESIKKINNFDYIIILEVLEHIPNSEEVILELYKKTNKALFYSHPNSGFFIDRLRLLFGRFPIQWRHHPAEHLRFWTFKDVKWTLKNLNLLKFAHIKPYAGIPILNKIFKNLFSEALIVKISKNQSKRSHM